LIDNLKSPESNRCERTTQAAITREPVQIDASQAGRFQETTRREIMNCEICGADNLRDYPLCPTCETKRHYTNRPCRCESCATPEIFPEALRARFPGLVLIARSDDPADLRRVEFTFDALKPECRTGVAVALSNLLNRLAKAA